MLNRTAVNKTNQAFYAKFEQIPYIQVCVCSGGGGMKFYLQQKNQNGIWNENKRKMNFSMTKISLKPIGPRASVT